MSCRCDDGCCADEPGCEGGELEAARVYSLRVDTDAAVCGPDIGTVDGNGIEYAASVGLMGLMEMDEAIHCGTCFAIQAGLYWSLPRT